MRLLGMLQHSDLWGQIRVLQHWWAFPSVFGAISLD